MLVAIDPSPLAIGSLYHAVAACARMHCPSRENRVRAGRDSTRETSMSGLQQALEDLVKANRILAHESVIDGFGHISIRHPERPDRFFLSRSRSPELVTLEDLMEYDLDCNPIDQRGRAMYAERVIHGGILKARPDVNAVIHHHAHPVMPFTFTNEELRPVFHMGGVMGKHVPKWDIRTKFGDTDLLVVTMDQGLDLARALGNNRMALLRRHGCVVVGTDLRQAVFTAVYSVDNAKLQRAGREFGELEFLSDGEIERSGKLLEMPVAMNRAWEYWCRRCGVMPA
jgi:ribulose-5-phosphate 4-epimerase/fuculose-1-phosphate aldolase